MKYELKSVGYWSVIKISFIVNLVAGFIFGLLAAMFMGMFMGVMQGMGGMSGMPAEMYDGLEMTGVMLIFLPFFYSFFFAFFNTILALIIAFVYNLATRLLGGLEFDLQPKDIHPSTSDMAPQAQAYQPPQPTRPAPPPPPPPPVEPLPPEINPATDDPNQDKP